MGTAHSPKALLHLHISGHPLHLQGQLRNSLQDDAVAPHLSRKQRAVVENASCLMVKPELQRRPLRIYLQIHTASPEYLISHCDKSRHTIHFSQGS